VTTVAGAAYLAFLVHAGIDWDWEPAVTLAALGCAAALLVVQRGETTLVQVSGRWRAVTAVSAAVAAIVLVTAGQLV
jgi:hypothetical protein